MAQIHKELTIQGKNKSAEDLVRTIKGFCAASSDYVFLTSESEDYQRGINDIACMIADTSSAVYPGLAFAASGVTSLYLTNIVPKHVSQIFIKEYNEIASRFIESFSQFIKDRNLGIRIVTTSDELTLVFAIPGKKTRELFDRYLALHPTSYHRCDIDRLDAFICAAFRYCRKKVDVDLLRRYLVEVLEWKAKDAEWCCDRIETGLDILRVNKQF
jgi:hypothetical protein